LLLHQFRESRTAMIDHYCGRSVLTSLQLTA
jgi:hypothetical protein